MDMAQRITSMVLALRRKVNIKVRQPLAQIMVPAIDATQKKHIEAVADLIKQFQVLVWEQFSKLNVSFVKS